MKSAVKERVAVKETLRERVVEKRRRPTGIQDRPVEHIREKGKKSRTMSRSILLLAPTMSRNLRPPYF